MMRDNQTLTNELCEFCYECNENEICHYHYSECKNNENCRDCAICCYDCKKKCSKYIKFEYEKENDKKKKKKA